MANALVEVLARASRGQASFRELAAALNAHDTLWGIPSLQQVQELLAAAKTPGGRAGAVAFNGIRTADGEFGGLLFTDDDRAAAYGRSNGLADAEGGVPVASVPPLAGIVRCLVHSWDGLVLDAGTDHAVSLELSSVKRLHASMTREAFARRPELHVVLHLGRPLVQSEGESRYAFVYEAAETAAAGIAQQPAGVTAAPRPTGALLEEFLAAGVTRLVVDPKLPLQRTYDRTDLEQMVAATRVTVADDATGAVIRAGLHATRPMVPPRGRPDVDGRAAFQAVRASVRSGERRGWQYLETVAFEFDVHVPVHPQRYDGLSWPQIWDKENPSAPMFTSAELAAFMVSTNAPDARRVEHMAGIEALRWLWSARPRRPGRFVIDLKVDGKDVGIAEAADALLVFFPWVIDLPDLAVVPRVGLAKVGALPGARGLKPEAARALVQGARTLMTLAAQGGAPPTPVAHAGGRYLPAFSDADQFFAFTAREKSSAKPARPASGNPFAEWLTMAVDVDGVVLDPAGPAPLALTHADLLVLGLRTAGSQPRGAEGVKALASVQALGKLPARLAGRIAAEWPDLTVLRGDGDANPGLLCPRDRTGGAIFTSPEAAQRFIDAGGCAAPAKPYRWFPRWADSPFETMLLTFHEAWLDPEPSGGGLHLDEEALISAVEVLDERLQPRVPWFAA